MSSTPRYRLGRDLVAIELTPESVLLEGRSRLRPGRLVELVDVPSTHGSDQRRALVDSWSVARLGKEGPVYRGKCRWIESSG